MNERKDIPGNVLYKTVFKEWDLSVPKKEGYKFELQDYYDNPKKYKGVFEQYIPHLSVLMNCMYWDERYPKIVTKDYLDELFSHGTPKLTVIGDITCDPNGSVECTHKGTEIEDPIFVYDPFTGKPGMGHTGTGMQVMAVDILPSELPRESSIAFSDALFPFVKEIGIADINNVDFANLRLPDPIKNAVILHKGELTPDYKYLEKYI